MTCCFPTGFAVGNEDSPRYQPLTVSQWTPQWRYFFEMDTATNGDQSLIALATRLAQVGQERRAFAPSS